MRGKFRIPSGNIGDLNISWDKDNPDDIEQAEKLFKELQKKGFKFVALVGGKMKKLKDFNPDAEQLLVIGKVEHGC